MGLMEDAVIGWTGSTYLDTARSWYEMTSPGSASLSIPLGEAIEAITGIEAESQLAEDLAAIGAYDANQQSSKWADILGHGSYDSSFNEALQNLLDAYKDSAGANPDIVDLLDDIYDALKHPVPDEGGMLDPGGAGAGAMDILASLYDSFVNPPNSPLVIDMDGDGVELISLENSTTQFDIDVDGFAELTGWVAADDALLAYDVNGNGIIDNQSELFGNSIAFANGFLALADLDSNSDGLIDSNDAAYADLVVWQDVGADGYSDSDELISLSSAGIVSIDLGSTSEVPLDL